MEKLPDDIMIDILSRLPYQTMINSKLVCKPWRDVSSNIKEGLLFQHGKYFESKLCFWGEQYSHKTLLGLDDHRFLQEYITDMVGSCNGLVCFSGWLHIDDEPIIYICNPITDEYIYLPTYSQVYETKKPGFNNFSFGFGYHHSTDEYKVVRIYRNNYKASHVQVYTLGSGLGWRDIGRIDHCFRCKPGAYANKALHWFVNNEIVAFDLTDEEFRSIELPPPLLQGCSSYDRMYLKLLGGHLCVVHIDEADIVHIWALENKKKFDDLWGWSKKFSIPCLVPYKPFAVTKSNQVLMSYNGNIFCYDSETTVPKELWDASLSWPVEAIPHVNSLVSSRSIRRKIQEKKIILCVKIDFSNELNYFEIMSVLRNVNSYSVCHISIY